MKHSGDNSGGDIARAVRDACVEAARRGYEEAAMSGLCEQGRIEMTLDAIRDLRVEDILERLDHGANKDAGEKAP